jgi:hypothetical protein
MVIGADSRLSDAGAQRLARLPRLTSSTGGPTEQSTRTILALNRHCKPRSDIAELGIRERLGGVKPD